MVASSEVGVMVSVVRECCETMRMDLQSVVAEERLRVTIDLLQTCNIEDDAIYCLLLLLLASSI